MNTVMPAALAILLITHTFDSARATIDCSGDYRSFLSGNSPDIDWVERFALPHIGHFSVNSYDTRTERRTCSQNGMWDEPSVGTQDKAIR